jgi:hypothetical protein
MISTRKKNGFCFSSNAVVCSLENANSISKQHSGPYPEGHRFKSGLRYQPYQKATASAVMRFLLTVFHALSDNSIFFSLNYRRMRVENGCDNEELMLAVSQQPSRKNIESTV